MKVNLYSLKIKKTGTYTLPKVFNEKVNESLLAQAIHVYRDSLHQGTSKTKTRGEVSLTKTKWYRQKGTGRARHGSKSAPIFVGGGVAHGPKGVKRILKLPKKMKQKALASALSFKAKEKQIAAVKDLSIIKKTKEAQMLVKMIREGENIGNQKITFFVSDKNKGVFRFFRNINRVKIELYSAINAYKVYFGGRLVIDAEN